MAESIMKGIMNQIQKCAALMSDPVVMRLDPPSVAEAITQAFNKIEQLQALLPPPREKTCDCESTKPQLLDASIINKGVKQLVSLALVKQLEVLKKPLPSIILSVDFKGASQAPTGDDHENLVEREIKENNSMACMLLLYYYLLWHLLLLFANKRFSEETENEDTLADIIGKLPKSSDFFEYRRIHAMFGHTTNRGDTIVELLSSHVLDDLLTSDFHPEDTLAAQQAPPQQGAQQHAQPAFAQPAYMGRKTRLMVLYRRVIKEILQQYDDSPADLFIHGNRDHPYTLFNHIEDDYILHHLSVFGGVLSTFHLNEGIQKWEDMDKHFQVIARTPDNRNAVHESTLRSVLSQPPYSVARTNIEITANKPSAEWVFKASRLAIYDYNNATLMVDVSKSAIRLAELVRTIADPQRHADAPAMLSSFLLQFTAHDPTLQNTLSTRHINGRHSYTPEFREFIQPAPNAARVGNGRIKLTPTYAHRVYIDDVPVYYVGSGPVNIDSANHVYIACPGVTVRPNEASLLTRIQLNITVDANHNPAEITRLTLALPAQPAPGDPTPREKIRTAISPLIRNSLFTTHGINAAIALLEKSKKIVQLSPRGRPYQYPPRIPPNEPCNELFQHFQPNIIPAHDVSRTEILEMLKKEQQAYFAYVTRFSARGPRLMPGISWPTRAEVPGQGDIDNHAAFDLVRYVPNVVVGSMQEVVGRMDQLIDAARYNRGPRP